jgi:hypothetical protein
MKFITVTATFQYVCVIDEDEDEYGVAEEYVREAMNDLGPYNIEYGITDGIHCSDWDDMCIPYHGDGNTRTSDYKKMMEKQ